MQRTNFESNREFWDHYAKHWNKCSVFVENSDISEEEKESYIKYLGDEWGRVEDVVRIVVEYIDPFITQDSVVAELGVGGARIASKVVENVQELHCFDISEEMLNKAKASIGKYSQAKFHLMKHHEFEEKFCEKLDFIYSFDVFVHFDLVSIWKYLNEIYKVLKHNGRAFIHTSNMTAPQGWSRFEAQRRYGEGLYYPTTPEAIRFLIEKTKMRIIKESTPEPSNFYLERDYLVIMQK